jgi:hypothetical protein
MSDQRAQQPKVELLRSLQQSWWSGDAGSFKQTRDAGSSKAACGSSSSSSSSDDDTQREQLLEALLLAHLVSDIHQAAAAEDGSSSSSSTKAPSFPTAAAAVLSILGQLVLNGVAIRPFLAGGGGSSSGGQQGLGLFPATALFNHSCDPNCSIRWGFGGCV